MKTIIYSILFLLICHTNFGQSLTLQPGSEGYITIPTINSLGRCSVTEKGKIAFLTSDNNFYFCNGSSWTSSLFNLPLDKSQALHTTYSNGLLKITNTHTSSEAVAINGTATGNYGYGVIGSATNTAGISTVGVYGENRSTTGNGIGVYGYHYGSGMGVNGVSPSGTGVWGGSSTGTGIRGSVTISGNGVHGSSVFGNGVYGTSSSGNGVYGYTTNNDSKGVMGYAENSSGVGVYGLSDGGIGVYGSTGSSNGIGGFFTAAGDGAAIITGAGNIGLGVSNPSEKLHVEGNIRASSLAGTGNRIVVADENGVLHAEEKTFIMAIPPQAFQRRYNTGGGTLTSSGPYGNCFIMGNNINDDLIAPVILPVGAMIKQIEVFFTDNDATNNLKFNLEYSFFTSTSNYDVVSLFQNTQNPQPFTVSSITSSELNETVTEHKTFRLMVSPVDITGNNDAFWNNTGTSLSVKGVKITYTY